jgi:uncharacterized membrane protein
MTNEGNLMKDLAMLQLTKRSMLLIAICLIVTIFASLLIICENSLVINSTKQELAQFTAYG